MCIVRGEKYHGKCEKKEKCVNCRGNHKANDRKCKMYIRQEEIEKWLMMELMDKKRKEKQGRKEKEKRKKGRGNNK